MLKKLKRTLTCLLPVSKTRTGSCVQCGACCKLGIDCPFLRTKPDGSGYCAIYCLRPPNCRKYPRSASEHITRDTCGFSFTELQDAPKRKP